MTQERLISKLQQIMILAEESLRLARGQAEPRPAKKKPAQARGHGSLQVDFNKPLRPFMKSYAKGLSGPKKFTLLLSRLTKGDLKKEVKLKEIASNWNRMTKLLEMKFNRFFPAQAKDNDWVESKKKGSYNLRPAWSDILKGKG